MPPIEETLRTLRDVQGVYGSFVITGSGELVARDLPGIFDGELFAQVGPRAARLYETLVSGGDELESCILRYEEHKVVLRRMTWGLIGVISAVAVNMPALRMVVNLVVRRIDPDVAPSARLSIAAPVPVANMPPVLLAPARELARAHAKSNEVVENRAGLVDPRPASSPPPRPKGGGAAEDETVVAQDGRGSVVPSSGRHVRMYRGRRVEG